MVGYSPEGVRAHLTTAVQGNAGSVVYLFNPLPTIAVYLSIKSCINPIGITAVLNCIPKWPHGCYEEEGSLPTDALQPFTDHRKQLNEAEKPVQSINA